MIKGYYEVELSNCNTIDRGTTGCDEDASICIIANHYPSINEVMEFCKKDMDRLGYKYVVSVTDITYAEAHRYFKMDAEKDYPILLE